MQELPIKYYTKDFFPMKYKVQVTNISVSC